MTMRSLRCIVGTATLLICVACSNSSPAEDIASPPSVNEVSGKRSSQGVEATSTLAPSIASAEEIRIDHNNATVEALALLGNARVDITATESLINKCVLTPTHFMLGRRTSCNRPAAIRILGLSKQDDCADRWRFAKATPPIADVAVYLCYDPTLGDLDGGRGNEWHSESAIVSFIPVPALLFHPMPGMPSPGSESGRSVLCADGSISQSGGKRGACSHHGGVS